PDELPLEDQLLESRLGHGRPGSGCCDQASTRLRVPSRRAPRSFAPVASVRLKTASGAVRSCLTARPSPPRPPRRAPRLPTRKEPCHFRRTLPGDLPPGDQRGPAALG